VRCPDAASVNCGPHVPRTDSLVKHFLDHMELYVCLYPPAERNPSMRTANLPKKLLLVGILSLGLGGCDQSNGGGSGKGGTTSSPGGSGGTSSSTQETLAGGTSGTVGTVASGGSTGSGGAQGSGGASSGKGGAGTTGASSGAGGTRAERTVTGGRVGTGGTTTGTSATATGGTISETGGRGSAGASALTGGNTGRGGTATGGRSGSGGATGGMGGGNTGGQTTVVTTGAGGDPVPSDGCGKTPSLKTGKALSISVSGTSRTYNLAVPDNYDNKHPYRFILSYHWMNGTANNVTDGSMAKPYYGLWDLAAGSTIFVAPQGTGNMWSNSGGVDVEFSRQLITLIESEFCIDKTRIFCEGFSMGGSMSYAMACAMPDVIRGVAVHSGGSMSGCVSHSKPVAYFMTHGTNDTMCDYTTFGLKILSDFAKVDGCTTTTSSLPVPTSTASACLDFAGCKAGYPVRACSFVGPHTPSPDGTSGWVPKESWKFISQF
jgi:poly(3-hydroxybutyrate) depolymerase